MRVRLRLFLAALAMLAVSKVSAEPVGSYFYVSPVGGFTVFDGTLRFPTGIPVRDKYYFGLRTGYQLESWLGLEAADVIDWVARDGLQFDPVTKVGTVLHMLAGLAIDGRFGVTAIAHRPAEADAMYEAVRRVVQRLADRRATDREPSPAWPQASADGG